MTTARLYPAAAQYLPVSKPVGWRGPRPRDFVLTADVVPLVGDTLPTGTRLRHEQTDWDTQAGMAYIVTQVFRVIDGDHAGRLVEFYVVNPPGEGAAYDWLPVEVRPAGPDLTAEVEAAIGMIPADWVAAIGPAASPERLAPIATFVASQPDTLPSPERVFAALDATPFDTVRAVILGQDPYPTRTHATGLAFSVPRDMLQPFPPSLMRIRAELEDGGWAAPDHGSLEAWTGKGVLLLNTILTVQVGHSGAHRRAGWADLTDAIITAVASKDEPVAFLLWGRYAQAKARLITASQHVVVCSPHPMARTKPGFRGSRPFSRANDALGSRRIDWSLTG